jgi:oligoribonuclease
MKGVLRRTTMAEAHLIWIDCEFTGLDPASNRIIEIATIITDSDLNIIAEGPNLAIHQSDELLDTMDEWNTSHHTESGLVEKVRASEVNEEEAERLTLEFVQEHTKYRKSPLCGNTIGQDRRFIRKYLPNLHDHFHYRSIDVSTVKELAKRWKPAIAGFKKAAGHRALDDIRESIAELAHFRENFFQEP